MEKRTGRKIKERERQQQKEMTEVLGDSRGGQWTGKDFVLLCVQCETIGDEHKGQDL